MAPSEQRLPGVKITDQLAWAQMQMDLRSGITRIPLLPLGEDAAYVWIPKNGCTTLKRAWLLSQGRKIGNVHTSALPHTHWLDPHQFGRIAKQRTVVAIWRDPVDRFVSACRSHLKVLTTGAIRTKLLSASAGDSKFFQEAWESYDRLFKRHGICSFDDALDPRFVMNQVVLQLPAWIACHLDWSHHTIPQVSYLGGDPSRYSTILGMEQIRDLVRHWRQASGRNIDLRPQHVSADRIVADRWRCLNRDQLEPQSIEALQSFYHADYAFLKLAQSFLKPLQI